MIKVDDSNNILDSYYTIHQLKLDNPNTSFPKNITSELLASYGVYQVEPGTEPAVASNQDFDVAGIELIDGTWTYTYKTILKDSSAISENVRQHRDIKLQECDWTQNRDIVLSNDSDWVIYRQELRDITTQAGFPFDVTWPTEPSS